MSFRNSLMFPQLHSTLPVGAAVCPYCFVIGRDSSPRAQLLNNQMVWCLHCARISAQPLAPLVRALVAAPAPWTYRNIVASFLSSPDTLAATGELQYEPFSLVEASPDSFRCRLQRDGESIVMSCSLLTGAHTPSYRTFNGESDATHDRLGAHSFLGKFEPGRGGIYQRICNKEKLRMKAEWVIT